ncbi:MAG: DUF2807 domain-containing protein, partial [Polyangiales bacterium]
EVTSSDGVETTLTIDPAQRGDVDLEVTAESNLLQYVATEVADDLLGVGITGSIQSNLPITVVGTVNDIREAQVRDGSVLVVEDIDRDTLTIGAATGARLTATGTVDSLSAAASKGATLAASDLMATTAEVRFSDGASAVLCVSDEVIGSVTDGATLTVVCGGDASGVSTSNGGTVN